MNDHPHHIIRLGIIAIIFIIMLFTYKINISDRYTEHKVYIDYTKNCNYVYHMLSVSKCGYDNAYGDKYSQLHNKKDLEKLKANEYLISISGGEYEGNLYQQLIATPASLTDSENVQDYYLDLMENPSKYTDTYPEELKEIATVFYDNYDIYSNYIYSEQIEELEKCAEKIRKKFDRMGYTEDIQSRMGLYLKDDFHIMLCTSIENGADAIFISENQDVFFTAPNENFEASISYMTHELGISIAKANKTALFNSKEYTMSHYKQIESTVEFYNRAMHNGYELENAWDYEYVNKIKSIYKHGHYKNYNELLDAVISEEENN